jgi:hypothetical protein
MTISLNGSPVKLYVMSDDGIPPKMFKAQLNRINNCSLYVALAEKMKTKC